MVSGNNFSYVTDVFIKVKSITDSVTDVYYVVGLVYCMVADQYKMNMCYVLVTKNVANAFGKINFDAPVVENLGYKIQQVMWLDHCAFDVFILF